VAKFVVGESWSVGWIVFYLEDVAETISENLGEDAVHGSVAVVNVL